MVESNQAKTGQPQAADACGQEHECRLVRSVFTLHHLMSRLGDRLASEVGLTSSRWLLLAVIGKADRPQTVGELSEASHQSIQNVSRMLQAMEAEGLVQRERGGPDGRSVVTSLTPQGEEALEGTGEIARRFHEACFEGVTEIELESLESGLEQLIGNLRAREAREKDRESC